MIFYGNIVCMNFDSSGAADFLLYNRPEDNGANRSPFMKISQKRIERVAKHAQSFGWVLTVAQACTNGRTRLPAFVVQVLILQTGWVKASSLMHEAHNSGYRDAAQCILEGMASLQTKNLIRQASIPHDTSRCPHSLTAYA